MEEVWKSVKGYEGLYEVSNFGRVRSLTHTRRVVRSNGVYATIIKGKVLSPLKRNHGYLAVMLYGKGGNIRGFKQKSIHTLVAEAFIQNPSNYTEINHIDEDKTNNHADNLEWCSREQNIAFGTRAIRSGRSRVGNPLVCKKIAQYTRDGDFLREYISIKSASTSTNVPSGNIVRCAKGDSGYSHAGGYIWKYIE